MNRFAHTIYSDDIRHEVGNKRSLIGIYSGKMFVPEFPVLLPKICMSIWIVTPANKPFKSLKVRVLADDNVVAEHPIDADTIAAQQPTSVISGPFDPEKPQIFTANFMVQISPYLVDKATTLRIRVVTEEEVLKGGALSIELAPKT
jgi:hypothetical protein